MGAPADAGPSLITCDVVGTGHRAPGTEHRAPGTEHRAQQALRWGGDAVEGGGAAALSELRHDFYASPGGDADAAAEAAACEALGTAEILLVLWGKRKELGIGGGLLGELGKHLRVSRGRLTLLQQSVACRYGERNPGRTNAELLVMFLYTCEAAEIDRVLQICAGTPPDGYVAQSPNIRMLIDRGLRSRDLRTIFDWICFISVLACTSTRLAADKIGHTLYRGLKGLTQEQVATLKQAKTDELHFLPPLSLFSLDVDAAVGDDYRQPDAAVLTIRGARAGTDLSHCVNVRPDADGGGTRGKDGEVMLPPLTCLRVKDIKYEQGLRVTYDYHGALLHPATSGDLP
eukprot:gene37472-2533_t